MSTTPPAPHPALPRLLLLLSATTGLVDAASVLGLGKVFTANMTGNVVFLGFAAARTPGFTVAPYCVALLAFVVGAIVAGRTGKLHAAAPLHRWLITAALTEAVLLWAAALIAIGFDIATQAPEWKVFALIGLTALAMGFRNATVRQLKVPDLTTTVLTLTLTGIASDSRLAGGDDSNLARRLTSVAMIFVGAAIGAFLVSHVGLAAPLALAGFVILAGTILCAGGVAPAAAQ
ncbi:YoaK family protein [Sphingomonas sp.]|uniref:YoaK family protein n=1 Tax=Sphingomonas sp. TaxID=28214 RepID=UPI000DB71BC3|nr:YoaK family protein [Sphingomonas sp.]PZU10201.1 MAG: DUF1275 domain-containing protein [Sphingomonas sp.]